MAIAQLTWSVPITEPAGLWWRSWTSSWLALRLRHLRWPHCIYQPTAATSSPWRSTRCRERSAWPTGISGQVLRAFTDQLVRIAQSASSGCSTPSEVLHHWPTQGVLRALIQEQQGDCAWLLLDISSVVRATTGQYPNTRTQHVFEDRFYWAGFNLHINRPFHIDVKQTKRLVKHLDFLVNQSENQNLQSSTI